LKKEKGNDQSDRNRFITIRKDVIEIYSPIINEDKFNKNYNLFFQIWINLFFRKKWSEPQYINDDFAKQLLCIALEIEDHFISLMNDMRRPELYPEHFLMAAQAATLAASVLEKIDGASKTIDRIFKSTKTIVKMVKFITTREKYKNNQQALVDVLLLLHKNYEWCFNHKPLTKNDKDKIGACVSVLEHIISVHGTIFYKKLLFSKMQTKATKKEINNKKQVWEKMKKHNLDQIISNLSRSFTSLVKHKKDPLPEERAADFSYEGRLMRVGSDGFFAKSYSTLESVNASEVVANQNEKEIVYLTAIETEKNGEALDTAFRIILDHHQWDPALLSQFATSSVYFDNYDNAIVCEAVTAWASCDYKKSISLMIPRLEQGLATAMSTAGIATRKESNFTKGVSAKTMGDILNDHEFSKLLDPGFKFYLKSIYTDSVGMNVRNNFAHGVSPGDVFIRRVANWALHSLLAFSNMPPILSKETEEKMLLLRKEILDG